MKKRAILVINGLVQGVSYRYNARRKAKELGLMGTVRNMEDGTVEVVLEGDEDEIKTFVTWAKNGPDHAIVENIRVVFQDYRGSFKNFSIIR